MRQTAYRFKRDLPFYIDMAVSPFVRPQQAIVLTGFWRSGTTWAQRMLADLIHAKTIFEPLEEDVRRHYHFEETLPPPFRSVNFLKAHMPFAEGMIPRGTKLYCLFEDSLRGRVPGKRVRINRNGIAESLRTRVVVKLVRGQLAVCGMHKTFPTFIWHIYRDPRAVLASVIRNDWGGEWMRQLSLRGQLLDLPDGRADFFEAWRGDILLFDQQPWWERVMAYWALTEIYVRHCSQKPGFPIISLSYEDLARGGSPEFYDALSRMTMKSSSPKMDAARISPTTDKARFNIPDEARLFGWKKELPVAMADRAARIAGHFGLSHCLKDG